MKILNIFFVAALLVGCKPKTENEIAGKWLMYKVIQDGEDVTSEHNPYGERYLILRKDSTFESGGRPSGMNTGRYEYNSVDHTLFLDSDVGPEDDSQWRVRIQGDTMHWQGYGTEWAKAFELIQIKDT
jgi:hypothetical protein